MRCPPTSTDLATSVLTPGTGAACDAVPDACPPWAPTAVESRPTAVILDLFGTLVSAPDSSERSAAAAQLAWAMRLPMAIAEAALCGSWQPRHDGQLRSSTAVATHLIERCGASAACTNEVEAVLARMAHQRLQADRTLLQALKELRQGGIRLAVLVGIATIKAVDAVRAERASCTWVIRAAPIAAGEGRGGFAVADEGAGCRRGGPACGVSLGAAERCLRGVRSGRSGWCPCSR